MELPTVKIRDYTYDLPQERIAIYPLPWRDKAKLLLYNEGKITHQDFIQLPDLLPHNSILFFNNTKVIPARFIFKKETGANIEVFLLHPVLPSSILSSALAATQKSTWKCTVGNLKRWPEGLLLKKEIGEIVLCVHERDRKNGLIEFSWTPSHLTFAEILHAAGGVPLPPYIKRKTSALDHERYQTIYSHVEGAVAAPTAGLHFTNEVLAQIRSRNIIIDFLTLHISASTFLPVKVENAVEHSMHEEQIIISRSNIENLLQKGKEIIAVGTTAMRTLESLYWYGVLLMDDPDATFMVDKFLPYQKRRALPSRREALEAIKNSMQQRGITEHIGHTSIYILPGYHFKVCQGLITNFHQPGSTLLLLIAAFVGSDWKKIYEEALKNQYRFLSYGDSSMLIPGKLLKPE